MPPPIRTISNFRDVGGWPTREGRRVRTGRLFRSGHLGGASDEDLARLAGLGIRTVIDFRGAQDEDADGPSRLPAGARRVNIPMSDPAGASDIRELLYRSDAAGLVTERCAEFGALLRGLAALHPLPALMHCSAGKDRTGWAASLVLLVLGVDEELVIEHYLLSNEQRREENDRLLANHRPGMDPEWIRPFLEVRPDYARAALAAADERFGSFDAYVEVGLGVDAEMLARLRAELLE